MEAVCFKLSGRTAFFKKPEVNSYVYFTYGNIHKIALLGIFGAILGYGGHTQKFNQVGQPKQLKEDFPEFYEKLKQLHVSVIPSAEGGFIHKKIQVFNNSVGYAMKQKEGGGNLIVKEQWLEEPSWHICVLLDCEEAIKLCEALQEKRCVYIPYLGKNDHFADISDVCVEKVDEVKCGKGKIASLFPKEKATLQAGSDFWAEDEMSFKYEEKTAGTIDVCTNNYILQSFICTDAVVSWENQEVYCINQRNAMFY